MRFPRDRSSFENPEIRLLAWSRHGGLRIFCRLDTLVFVLPTRILSFYCAIYPEHRNVGHKTMAK
jgi:hypothetical protein